MKMNFSSNFFLKPGFFRCFRELNVRKFRKFSPDHFYDENFQFYDKKTDFRPGMEISSETTIPGISSETTVPGISSETTETLAHEAWGRRFLIWRKSSSTPIA